MAYVPDNLGERRRKDNVSQTACEFFIKYCEHADKETGLTFANVKTCAEAFEMRSDNARGYDKELIDKGWIKVVESDGKTLRKVEAGWMPLSQRNGQGKAENTKFLNFRKELENLLNFRENSYILGELPKFKENLLNFRKTYKEYIDQHLDQHLDQLIGQLEDASGGTGADNPADSDEAEPNGRKRKAEKPGKLPEDFTVTDDLRIWASKNAPNVGLEIATQEFITFWREIAIKNHRRTTLGWKATWRNRITTLQEKFEEKKGAKNGSSHKNGFEQNGNGNHRSAGKSDSETVRSRLRARKPT